MTRTEYLQARRLVRDNGPVAIKWMAPHVADAMDVLIFGQGRDRLAERARIVAYCRRKGIPCTLRHTS